MAGRPPKLTPEIQAKIVEVIADGNYQEVACRVAGIAPSTFHLWISKGSGDDARKPYSDFVEAVTRAEADCEATIVRYWQSAMKDDWRAARDYLARRHPERWKSTERREHTGADGGPIGLAVLDDIMEGEEEE